MVDNFECNCRFWRVFWSDDVKVLRVHPWLCYLMRIRFASQAPDSAHLQSHGHRADAKEVTATGKFSSSCHYQVLSSLDSLREE